MPRRWISCVVLLFAVCVPAARAADTLAQRLEAVLASPALRRARVAALVVRESDGQVLFAHAPDRALTPASNQKLLTAAVALDVFGPTHRFETLVTSDRPPDAAGAVASLRVRGGGDPALNSEDWWMLASALRSRGLRRVKGDLVLDDTAFDRERWHPAWGRPSSRAYHAPVGALTANYSAFAVTVEPGGRAGARVGVAVDPPVPYLRLVNHALTGPSTGRRLLVVDRAASDSGDFEVVRVSGRVPAGAPARTLYRSVLDPTRYAGAVLRMQLSAVGIRVDGATRILAGAAAEGSSGRYELLRYRGRPLAEIVRLFVKYSNNAVAESLVKALGRRSAGVRGSWRNGTRVLRRHLEDFGLDPKSFSLVDGSGLSAENKLTPRSLVRLLLRASRSFRFGPELMAALPIAGMDGTLKDRAAESRSRVRAKTGLLSGVTALSGFAETEAAERVVFSILVNGYRVSDERAMEAVDRFVGALVGSAGGAS